MRQPIPAPKTGVLAAVFLTAVIFSLSACASRQAATPEKLPGTVSVKSVAVMPYIDMYQIYGENVSFNCPLCGSSQVIGRVSEGADDFLTETLFSMLQEQGAYQLISPGEVQGVQSTLLLNPEQEVTDVDLILGIGKKLDADAVVLGRVYRFREREGSAFAAETPASVTLDLLLFYVADGQLLWEGHFSETQQALTENLLNWNSFVNRGGRWLTAEELATYGLERMMVLFPKPN